jgi:ribosomal protein S21
MASLTRAKVEVMDNQVEAALKTLKKVAIKGGLYQG